MIITAVNAFELFATLSLQTTAFENALKKAQSTATTAGNGIKSGFSGLSDLFTSAGEAIKNGLETAVKTATAAITAASAAVVGLGKKAIDAGMSFDSAMSQVAATMGRTVEDLNDDIATVKLPSGEEFTGNLRDFAKKMGAETKFSATEAAGALNYMALAGYSVTESMEMMPNVLNLASAGAMNLQQASDMLTDTQKALGLDFDRTNKLVDEMAKAASTGNTSVSQLGEAFLTVGGLAKEANGGFVTLSDGTQAAVDGVQEMEIAFTAMANAGVKGSEAGTHMRNMLLKLASPTEAGTKAFEEMGISVYDTEGRMRSLKDIFSDLNVTFGNMSQADKLAKISDIFNARDTASAEALLAAVEQDWDKIGESILNAEGAAQGMANTQLNNLNGAITIFKSALEGVYIEISEKLTPSLVDFVKIGQETLSNLIPAIKDGDFNSITRILENAFTQALDKVTTLVPKVLQIAGTLVSTLAKGIIRNIPHVLKVVKQSLEKANKGDISNSLITQIFDNISNSLPAIGRFVREIIKSLTKRFSQRIPELMKSTTKLITSIAVELTKPSNISAIINAGIQIVVALAKGFSESISVITKKIPEIIKNLKESFKKNKDNIKGAGLYLWSGIKTGFINAVSGLDFDTIKKKFIEPLMKTLSENSSKIYYDVILPAWKFVVKNLPNLINNIVSIIDFKEIAKAISAVAKDFLDGVSEFVEEIDWKEIGTKIGDFLSNIDWYGILKKIFELLSSVIKGSTELLNGLIQALDFDVVALAVGGAFAVSMIKQLATTIMTNPAVTASLAQASSFISSQLIPAIGAFSLGWAGGTAIRKAIGEDEVDEFLEPWLEVWYSGLGETERVWGEFKDNVSTGWQEIGDILSGDSVSINNALYPFFDSVSSGWQEIKNMFTGDSELLNGLLHPFFEAWEVGVNDIGTSIDNFVTNSWQGFKTAVSIGLRSVKTKFTNFSNDWVAGWESIKNGIKDIVDNIGNWGADLIDNFINGVKSKWDEWTETWADGAEIISDFFHHSTPKKGPLKDDDKWTADMMDNFINGMTSKQSYLERTVDDTADIISGLNDNSIITPEIKTNGIQGISDGLNRISETEMIINPIIDNFELPETVSTVKTIFEKFNVPEIPDILAKVNTVFSEFKSPEISDKTANISYNYEKIKALDVEDVSRNVITAFQKFDVPEILDSVLNIEPLFGSFELPNIPDSFAKVKTIFEEVSVPEIKDISRNAITTFQDFDIPEIPDQISKIETIFEKFNVPEIPEILAKIRTDFEKTVVPEVPDRTATIKSVFKSANIPDIPTLSTNISTVFQPFEIPSLPVLPELTEKATVNFDDIRIPQISDVLANVKTIFDDFNVPEAPDRTSKIISSFEITDIPDIPNFNRNISTNFEDFTIPKISDRTSEVKTVFQSFEVPEIEDLISKVKTVFEKFDIPEMPELSTNASVTFDKIQIPEISELNTSISELNPSIKFDKISSPEIPELFAKIKTVFESVDIPTIPDIVAKVKTIFEKFTVPEVSDISVNANTKFSDFEQPEIADKTAEVNYDYEKPENPVISDITAKIKSVFESFDLPKIPDIFAKIKAIFGEIKIPTIPDIFANIKSTFNDIETPEIPDIISKIKTVFESFDIPELEDIKVKIKGIFEDFKMPEIPDNQFRVTPEFQMPEIGTLQYTAQSQATDTATEQPIVINELVVNMQNSVSNDYDVDRIPEKFIRKLSGRIDTYKYRNRRGVGGTE